MNHRATRLQDVASFAAGVLIGASIVTGTDRQIETALVEASPQWLTELTTRF